MIERATEDPTIKEPRTRDPIAPKDPWQRTGHNSGSRSPFDILTSALGKTFHGASSDDSPEAHTLHKYDFLC